MQPTIERRCRLASIGVDYSGTDLGDVYAGLPLSPARGFEEIMAVLSLAAWNRDESQTGKEPQTGYNGAGGSRRGQDALPDLWDPRMATANILLIESGRASAPSFVSALEKKGYAVFMHPVLVSA